MEWREHESQFAFCELVLERVTGFDDVPPVFFLIFCHPDDFPRCPVRVHAVDAEHIIKGPELFALRQS